MTTLTDTQRLVLDAARLRPNHAILPLPETLKGGAAQKVVDSLIAKGLAEEREAGEGEPVWRERDAGYGVTLIATHSAMEAIGAEPAVYAPETAEPDPADAAQGAPDAADTPEPDSTPSVAESAATPAPDAPRPRTREGTKQALLIAMLCAEGGATIDDIAAATGWRPHTVRGAIAGALKKRLGLDVTSEKVEGRGRIYRLPPA